MSAAEPCRWCGETHGFVCPMVKAFNFDAFGNVTRVEFVTMADFPQEQVKHQDGDEPTEDYPRLRPMGGHR